MLHGLSVFEPLDKDTGIGHLFSGRLKAKHVAEVCHLKMMAHHHLVAFGHGIIHAKMKIRKGAAHPADKCSALLQGLALCGIGVMPDERRAEQFASTLRSPWCQASSQTRCRLRLFRSSTAVRVILFFLNAAIPVQLGFRLSRAGFEKNNFWLYRLAEGIGQKIDHILPCLVLLQLPKIPAYQKNVQNHAKTYILLFMAGGLTSQLKSPNPYYR